MPSTARLLEVQRAIAANIRRWRARRGMTQEDLAEKAGLGDAHLRAIERGTKNVTLATLLAISDALDTSPGHLLRKAKLPKLRPGRPKAKSSRLR